MTVAMIGRQLAFGALWANGASLEQCAQIMGVGVATVHSVRRSIRRKYAAEGITIVDGVHTGKVLVEHPPAITPTRKREASADQQQVESTGESDDAIS